MDDFEEALALEVRRKIYEEIKVSPGLHFRELQRRVNLATGSLQYHLDYLAKKHLVKMVKEKKFTRFYLIREGFEQEKEMGILRQESMRKIVLLLLQKKKANNRGISKAIGLSPSTTSWHLQKMLEQGVIEKKRRGRQSYYYLVEPERAANLLIDYRKSFLDTLVDNFAETWQEVKV